MLNKTLRKLLDGKYICPISAPDEFEILGETSSQTEVDAWLGKIDLRLARLGTEGAFFAAPRKIELADALKVRDEFARYRDIYGPAVQMMNLVRHAKDEFGCRMGDVVQLAELMSNVAESATMETQLRSLHGVISGTATRLKNREFLQKLLEHLRNDGYLMLTNPQTETYTVTGKVEQLALAMQYMAEHEGIASEEEDEKDDEGPDLFDPVEQVQE